MSTQQVDTDKLYEEIQALKTHYPARRGAVLPALRLAQEAYGWLPPEAFEVLGDALDYSPAYCQSVASFYDMFFLEPVGTHVIEVCTNLSCALLGASEVLTAFEENLGVKVGETTEDRSITLRKVECLGGCGWGPVVAVDEVFHENFKPSQAARLAEDTRKAPRAHG